MVPALRSDRAFLPVIIMGVLLALSFAGGVQGEILPSELSRGGWRMEGSPARFVPDNLHTHINGEAELYFPYGFKEAWSAFFVSSKNKGSSAGVAVDLFLMASPLDAFGIYSRYRSPDAQALAVGAGGTLSDSQILFWKGAYFVRLSVSGDMEVEHTRFKAMAEELAGRIPGEAVPPPETGLLRIPGLVPRSERYDAPAVLGYRFFGSGLSADATLNGNTVKVFILLSPPPKAAAAFDDYAAYLRQKGPDPVITEGGGARTLRAVDPLYKAVAVRAEGGRVFGIIRLPDGESGEEMLRDLAVRMKTP
jgi:hypothetical protein